MEGKTERIRDIAILVDTGIIQRKKKNPADQYAPGTTHRIIKAKDIETGGIAPLETLDKVQEKSEERELETDDVLVATKGSPLKAARVEKAYEGCLFADTLTRIRVEKEIVIPEYLVLLLSLPFIKNKLIREPSGNIAFIPKKEIERLLIPVPEISIQNKLVEMSLLFEREKELTKELLELKQQLVDHTITQKLRRIINNDNK